MPFVEAGKGTRVFVQDWGSGKPFVLVHGWPLSHRMFEYQAGPLADRGHRVVAIDLRGFGESDKPWTGHDYDTWAGDIDKVVSALNLQDATLCGFSMGGAIAMHYAATHHDKKVTRLALLAAAGPCYARRPDNPQGVPREVLEGFIREDCADRAVFTHKFGALLFHRPVSPEFAHWIDGIGMQASSHAHVRGLEELRDRDLRQEVGAIRIPTRIFHGVHDQIVPFALGEEQQRTIRNSTLVRFEESGHGLFYDEHEKLTEELAKFAAEPMTKGAA